MGRGGARDAQEQLTRQKKLAMLGELAASERLISSFFDFARPKPSSWHKVDINEVVQNGTLILVADDDPGICITMKNIFMKKGYRVGIVHTGEEAVVIMMTAFRQEVKDIVEKALNDSSYTCLYKPLDMQEVLGLVEEIWKGKKQKGADTL